MKKFKKIYIEITNICNKNCSFCSKDNRLKQHMSVEDFEHIIKEIKPYTNYVYLHVKGEPLLHPHFDKILDICQKYEIFVNITTNGVLLSKKVDEITNFSCVRQINVSLHSFEDIKKEQYIKDILETTDKIQNKTNIIFVYRFWALKNNQLTEENQFLLDQIIQHYQLDQQQEQKIENDMNINIGKNLYINKAPLFVWPSLDSNYVGNIGFCYGMSRQIAILVDGTVVPCCLDSNGIINLGNIFKSPLINILEGKRAQDILKNFRNNKVVEELCQKCQYRTRFKRNML